jgi:heterokaryon incompatibility protein (HET)
MRLLNTESLELSRLYITNDVPDYAILSSRWSSEEATFDDISKAPISNPQNPVRQKKGFPKLEGAHKLAFDDGYTWIWIDSCCIDKSSSAELQEAINSMWRYYAESNICYVYMADFLDLKAGMGGMFSKSEWFTRGWTLQELIAPVCVEFYAENWDPIDTKLERQKQIAEITSIEPKALIRAEAVDILALHINYRGQLIGKLQRKKMSHIRY